MNSTERMPVLAGAALAALLASSCATAPALLTVDLSQARGAVDAAMRDEHVPESAGAFLAHARQHLGEAEALVRSDSAEDRRRAEALGVLAKTEAEAVTALAALARERMAAARDGDGTNGEAERSRLKARLARAIEDQKRLEEKGALLQRDLDATETELIRTKAKLKGIETKAEASSAIAEARILTLRMLDEKGRSAGLARSQEKLERAERQLREENYGAALFFALQAQELLNEARRAPAPTRKK